MDDSRKDGRGVCSKLRQIERVKERIDVMVCYRSTSCGRLSRLLYSCRTHFLQLNVFHDFDPSGLRFVDKAVDGTRQSPQLFSHVLESQQFDVATLKTIFQTADEMQQCVTQGRRLDLLQGRIMATLFYEPSTRTR